MKTIAKKIHDKIFCSSCFFLFFIFVFSFLVLCREPAHSQTSSLKAAWTKTLGGDYEDLAGSVFQTGDGGFVTGGITMGYGAGEGCDQTLCAYLTVAKLDAKGNKIWSKKFDAEGSTVWEKLLYGGTKESARAYDILETKDGGFMVVGSYFPSPGVPVDALVLKLDKDGNKITGKTYGGKEWDELYGIAKTSDGGFIAAGESYSFSENCLDNNCGEFYVIKIAP